ncbi:hypothetical protein [Actinoplanes regularis]|uniref:hypothetical protein n=1 Tax=Actinoplanes regularis TaxID=52697 RepID=UPI0025553DF7|nr:hypothetical protein [Actinoplanes regularis]
MAAADPLVLLTAVFLLLRGRAGTKRDGRDGVCADTFTLPAALVMLHWRHTALTAKVDRGMQQEDLVRAATAAVAFGVMLAGHYIGDHWVQTDGQAHGKGLDNAGCDRSVALWHCAKHVASWTLTTSVFLLAAGWWLRLPFQTGWLVAGITVNAVTHFVADLRTPLIRLGRLLGRGGYLDHVRVVRPSGPASSGPGTALFELDQAWHIGWLAVSALLIAGPPA